MHNLKTKRIFCFLIKWCLLKFGWHDGMEGSLTNYIHNGNFIVNKKNKDTIRKSSVQCSGKRFGFIAFFFRRHSTVNNRKIHENRRLLVIFGLPCWNLSHIRRMPQLTKETDNGTSTKLKHFIKCLQVEFSKKVIFFFWTFFFFYWYFQKKHQKKSSHFGN